jgi:ADP-heptose:LPS heptosyltransferase
MPRKVILSQSQSPGDVLTFTGAVRDLKLSHPDMLIDVRSPCPEIFENNPHITQLDGKDPEVEFFEIGYPTINESGWRNHHFSDAFRMEIEAKLGVKIEKTSSLPDLHISEVEKRWTNQVAMSFQYPGKFWLLNAGSKVDCELKQYPPEGYQKVVDLLRDKIQFVQIGHKDHIHPKLEGVYSLVGKTDLRQLIRLMWWAEGTLGPISFQMVLAAAFQKPAVVIAGGKESVHWQAFLNHRFLYTNGALKCCPWDGCWKGMYKECTNRVAGIPRCYALIRPEDVARAIEIYYLGGLLSYDSDVVHDWRDDFKTSTRVL